MPYFNSRGDVVMGIGDGIVSLNRAEIDRGGGARFLTDDAILYQRERDHQVVARRGPITLGLGFGANEIAAGGDQWAVWLAGEGLHHSRGGALPSAGLRDVGRDGTLALCVDRASGRGLRLLALQDDNAESRRSLTLDLITTDLHCHSWGNAIWRNERGESWALIAGQLQGPLPQITPSFRQRLVLVQGDWWVLYNTNEEPIARTILQRLGSVDGVVVAEGNEQFGLDGMDAPTGVVPIVWSRTEGEHPDHLVRRFVDLATASIVRITRSATPTPAPTPIPAPVPVPVEPPVNTPNYLDHIRRIAAPHQHLLVTNTRASCGLLTEILVWELSKIDPEVGHVDKDPGEEQWNEHSTDACKFRSSGQVVDMIANGTDGENRPAGVIPGSQGDTWGGTLTWQLQPSRETNEWKPAFAPDLGGETPQTPVPVPVPTTPPIPLPPASDALMHQKLDALLSGLSALADAVQVLVTRAQDPAPAPPSDLVTVADRLTVIGRDVVEVRQQLTRGFKGVVKLGKPIHIEPVGADA